MKGIMLPYGASLMIIGFAMLVTGLKTREDFLGKCGISKEGNGTLHECLSKYMQQKREALDNIKNSAGRKNYAVIQQLFRDSLKCFPEGMSKEKMCYLRSSHGSARPTFPKKGNDEFSFGAAAMYYGFRRNVYVLLRACKVDKTNTPSLFTCLWALNPEAQAIIKAAKTDEHQAFERMALLMSRTRSCYSNITSEQGMCLLEQNKILQKNITERMSMHGKEMVGKWTKCGISADVIETAMECTKPKAMEMIKLAFELYEEPEKAEKVWQLVEAMKACIAKYPEIKKCLMRGSFGRPGPKRPERPTMNPFHFETVTGLLLRYIGEKSGRMLKECQLDPRKMPGVFLCMKKKYEDNKDVLSDDPKKKFVGMMHLMNSTADCFSNVTETQGLCLFKNKQQMIETVNKNAVNIGQIMKRILKACNATSEDFSCVDFKEDRLVQLAKTLLTDPEIAETVWNVGGSLKDCLKKDPAVEKCVLNKKLTSPKDEGKAWRRKDAQFGKIMQKHIKEESMKFFAGCKVTPMNSPDVFSCLLKQYKESNMSSQDPKQIFISGMKLMKTSAVCFETSSDEQRLCLKEKKNELKDMMAEKSKLVQEAMGQMLTECGVSESETPALVNCFEPKRENLQKMVPELFNDPAVAETVWDSIVAMKKCFESKPDIMKCVSAKKNTFWMSQARAMRPPHPSKPGMGRPSKPGMGRPSKPRMGRPSKPGMGRPSKPGMGRPPKPGMGRPSIPGMRRPSKPGTGWESKPWMKKRPSKPENRRPSKPVGKSAFAKMEKPEYPEMEQSAQPKMSIMAKIGMVFEKCGISAETTPELDNCLQPTVQEAIGLFYRGDMDVGEKMKELKRLQTEPAKCFEGADDEMKKCMKAGGEELENEFIQKFKKSASAFDPKNAMASMDNMYAGCGITKDKTPSLKECMDERTRMVMKLKPWIPMSNEVREQLKEEGVKYWKCFEAKHSEERKCMLKLIEGFRQQGKPAGTESEPAPLSKKDIQEMIEQTKSEVLACSDNKCFHKRVEGSVQKFIDYMEEMQTKDPKEKGNEKLRQDITKETVRAFLCLRKESKAKRVEAFSCIKKVMNSTSDTAKKILKKITGKMGPRTGRKPGGGSWGKKGGPGGESMEGGNKWGKEGGRPKGPGRPERPGRPSRQKRAAGDEEEETALPFFSFLDTGNKNNEESSVTVFELMFNDQSMGRVDELLNLMKKFISTCTSWAPAAENLRSRDIFDAAEPPPTVGENLEYCKDMYADINSFIDTGHGNIRALQKMKSDSPHEHHHESSAVIIAVCTGSVVVGILVLLTIVVIFVARRRCQSRGEGPPGIAPTAPNATCPPVYTTYPGKHLPEAQMPPSYSECLDTEKYHPSGTQILSTSAREEGTEKSC